MKEILHLISIEATSRYEIAKAIQKYFNLQTIQKLFHVKLILLGLLEKRPLLINLDDSKYNALIGNKHYNINHYLKKIDAK